MDEKTNWQKFVALCKKAWRVIWRKYQKEIKSFVGNLVDNAFVELGKHVNTEVQKKIKNEIIKKAITDKVDIYTDKGALWIQDQIDEYMEKLSGRSE